jgi:CelD/BcsL family acetyltransferase involved in cellulose biosynthesis
VFAASQSIDPVIVIGTLEGRTAFLLPLYRMRGPLGARVVRFVGDGHANIRLPLLTTDAKDRAGLIQAAGDGSVLAAIGTYLEEQGCADLLALHRMPLTLDGEPNILLSHGAVPSGIELFSGSLMDDFEQLRALRRPPKSQRKTRQNIKKLENLGQLEFGPVSDSADLDTVLETFFRQKGDRLNDAGVASAFDLADNRAFIRHLAESSMEYGHQTLELFTLTLNDEPIAIAGGGRHGSRFSMAINSMSSEPKIAAHGPGRISINDAVALFCSQGMSSFDLGLGENEYKHMWCDRVDLVDIDLPLSKKGSIHRLVSRIKRAVINAIRHSPRLKQVAQRLRLEFRRLRSVGR